jgi:dolichol-phosphate mannosyltransferase
MISLVLPTYNEAASIRDVLKRSSDVLRATGEEFELIVMDDSSPDGTAELAQALADELPVRVVRRPRRSGLALAVVDGWQAARGDVLGVMDADLQHPPEVLTSLVAALRKDNVDLAIASRSGPGGGTADWSWRRRLTSWVAMHVAACVLPWTLAEVRDPMSGMFLVRRRALQGVRLEPAGYKILLEVLAKGRYREFTEASYMFGPRSGGNSKLGTRQSLEYVLHLARLARSTGQLRTWMRYAAVGFTGALVNVGVCVFLVEQAGWPTGLALAVAIQSALLSNFLWNKVLTFRRAPPHLGPQPKPDFPRPPADYSKVFKWRSAPRRDGASLPAPLRMTASPECHPERSEGSAFVRSATTSSLPVSRRWSGDSRGILARLLRYERVCGPGAVLNASLTFLLHGRGVALALASTAGVMLGGAWNLFFNVPAIWRTWGLHSSPSEVTVPSSVRPAGSVRL